MDTEQVVPTPRKDVEMTEDELQEMKLSNAQIKVMLGQLVSDVNWLKSQFVGNGKPGLLQTLATMTEQMLDVDRKYVSYGKALVFIGLGISAIGALGWFGYNHFATQVYASTTSYCTEAIKASETESKKTMAEMKPYLIEEVRQALRSK